MRHSLVWVWCALLGVAVDARAWFATVNGINARASGATSEDGLSHVAVDGAGDVVGAGTLSILLSGPPSVDNRVVVTKHAGSDGALRWQTLIEPEGLGSPGLPTSMALDAAGDAVVGGAWTAAEPNVVTFAVAKVAGATGAILWQRNVVGTAALFNHAAVNQLALDANGDVIAVGSAENAGTGNDAVVYKFDGASGATIWSRVIDGSATVDDHDHFTHVAVDGAGDVFVSGYLYDPTEVHEVMKLSGATGADLWPAPIAVTATTALAVEPGGDLVLVEAGGSGSTVRRLSSADGSEVWQHSIASAIFFPKPVFDGDDAVLSGSLSGRFAVVKIDGATGGELWTYLGSPGTIAVGAGVEPGGGISAGGRIDHPQTGTDFYAVRLDAVTGSERATYRVDGGRTTTDWVSAFALAPGGQIVLGGWVAEGGDSAPLSLSDDIAVLRFDERLAGKSIVVLDQGAASRLIVRAKDPQLLASSPGGPGDPTAAGATLAVTNPVTLESASVVLPASLWKATPGTKPGRVQYKYTDPAGSAGPCRTVSVKSGRVVKVKCLGSLGGFTLDEPSQGALQVRLTLGAGSGAYCLAFGDPSLDGPGQFRAGSAPPPASCV